MKHLVLVPVLPRKTRIAKFYQHTTSTLKVDFDLCLILDKRNAGFAEDLKGMERARVIVSEQDGSLPRLLNEAYAKLRDSYDVIYFINDDHYIEPGHDLEIERFFSEMFSTYPDKIVALWPNDKCNNRLCTVVVASRQYIDLFGYVLNGDYPHGFYSDLEFTDCGSKAGRLFRRQDIVIHHRHRELYDKDTDGNYKRFMDLEKRIYDARAAKGFHLDWDRIFSTLAAAR